MTFARLPYYPIVPLPDPVLRTLTPLLANAVFDTGVIYIDGDDLLTGTVFADQAGTLYIEQAFNATDWDVSTSYTITAGDGKGFREEVVADFGRVRYVNGGTNQGVFRLSVNLQ